MKSKVYSNRFKKNNDYDVLVNKLKEVNSDATVKKIGSFRAQHRREFKKKRESADDEY